MSKEGAKAFFKRFVFVFLVVFLIDTHLKSIWAALKDISKLSFNDGNRIFNQCDFERYKHCSLYVEAKK